MSNILQFVKSGLKNPLTEYLSYVGNWWKNQLQFKHLSQGYFSTIIDSKVGVYVKVYPQVTIYQSDIGSYTYVSSRTNISGAEVGKFCCIGPNCLVGFGIHPTQQFVSSHPIFYSRLKQNGITFAEQDYFVERKVIKIGNDVWIGANVIVLDGVTVGNGAIIAAGSVVNKDIPDYSIYGGVPAQFIRSRFDEETIEFLLQFQWWNQGEEWLKNNYKDFHSINKFREKYVIKD